MNDIPINKYSLKFPDALEQIYEEEVFRSSLQQLRINIIVVALIYALFGILDGFITPEVKYQTWLIRYCIITPIVIVVLAFSYSPHFKKYQQIAVFFLVMVGGGGIVAFSVLTGQSARYFHFAGLLLVFMTSYTSFKLRFLYATIAGWLIIGMYEIAALWIGRFPLSVFFTDNFFYLSANLMGMSFIYQRELYLRMEFYQKRRIQEIDQNRHVAEKVKLNEAVEKAVRSFKESEEKFRALAETTTASIVIHRGGKILYANPVVQASSGYTQDELLQMDFWQMVHPEYREVVKARGVARMSGGEAPLTYEFKVVTKSGEERWSITSIGNIVYEGMPAIIATLFDITDHKRTEEEKVRLYEERIQEEKRHMREKESLLMELHDGLGGITTNIGILAEVARMSNDLEQGKKTFATISQLSQEGVSEIRSFMSSLDPDKLSWHIVAAELRNHGTRVLEPHKIAFTFETSIDDGMTELPGSLLFVNLFKIYKETFTNIIKHAHATAVAATLIIARSGLQLTIQDNGIGFCQNGRTGHGLSNMRRRAEDMGGKMTLSSDHGARMGLEIPMPFDHPMLRRPES